MDPTDVMSTMWRHRWYVLPALLVAVVAAVYVFQFGPREYESRMSYAFVNPRVPTEAEIELNPQLGNLNADNPYLRSSDANLIVDAVTTRLGASTTEQRLTDAGLGPDYGVGLGAGGNGFILDIVGVGETPATSVETTLMLGTILEEELRALQTVNGADERYLFTPLVIAEPDSVTEKFSSRLRAVIMVLIGGAVLVAGAVSLGRFTEERWTRRRARRSAEAALGSRSADRISADDARSADQRDRVVGLQPLEQDPATRTSEHGLVDIEHRG